MENIKKTREIECLNDTIFKARIFCPMWYKWLTCPKTIFIQGLEVFVCFAFVKWLGKNGNSILMGLVTEQYAWMDLSIVD